MAGLMRKKRKEGNNKERTEDDWYNHYNSNKNKAISQL